MYEKRKIRGFISRAEALKFYKEQSNNPNYMEEPEGLRRGDEGWYLWHSYKNENLVLYYIGLLLPCLIMNHIVINILSLTIFFICKGIKNNEELDNDPNTKMQRVIYWNSYDVISKTNQRRRERNK